MVLGSPASSDYLPPRPTVKNNYYLYLTLTKHITTNPRII